MTTPSRLGSLLIATALVACAPDAQAVPDDVPADTPAPAPQAEAGPSAAIRIVNLWVDGGSGASIDVTVKPMRADEEILFSGVGFGQVTATETVAADTRLAVYRAGEVAENADVGGHFLTESDLESSARLTLVATYMPPISDGGPTAIFTIFYDTGEYVTGTMPARSVDGSLLVADFAPLRRVLGPDQGSLILGTPGAGCLRLAGVPAAGSGSGAIVVSGGGTAVVTYDVPPGNLQVAAYAADDGSCTGAPVIGPVAVDVAPSGRTYVFAYGTGPDDRRLVVVPSSAS